jgi:broad specificity phosphatase PhoE
MPALYVVRHGEPELTGVMLGRTDPALSARGREQMSSIHLPVEVVYASPLRRARESAELLPGAAPIVVIDDLMEVALGEWDGKVWSEIERDYPDLAARKLADWTAVTPPGGEPWSAFTARIDSALHRILKGRLPAAVVAHVAVNGWIAHRVAGRDPFSFQQPLAGVEEFLV